MCAFGKAGGGGRRLSSRVAIPFPAVVMTLGRTIPATVIDVSCTGARLRGRLLPEEGEEIVCRIDAIRLFGIVKWSHAGQCGIAFDEPLMPFEVDGLRRKANLPTLGGLTLEERLALEDWVLGVSK